MASGELDRVTVDVDALEGAIPAGSRLRVRVVDATAADVAPIELASVEVEQWNGDACRFELAVSALAANRDYVVLAHTGPDDHVAVGDWITMDNVRIVDHAARIVLRRV